MAFDIKQSHGYYAIDLLARNASTRKILALLYNDFLTKSKSRIYKVPVHNEFALIADFIRSEFLKLENLFVIKKNCYGSPKIYMLDESNFLQKQEAIKVFWWDGVANFGDILGPWLISMMTKRPIVNVRGSKSSNAIFSIGSIINMMNTDHINPSIWGSGLINTNSIPKLGEKLAKINIKKITAVRGRHTHHELTQKLGYVIPEVFGDPALLLPEYFTPNIIKKDRGVLVPHWSQFKLFENLSIDTIQLVNVGDDAHKVVSDIANAKFCIATSLHGIIVAQAYNVPWVWLNIKDKPLHSGKHFKFHDFFSILENDKIVRHDLNISDISQENIRQLIHKAYLPKFNQYFNKEALIEAFYQLEIKNG